jgi:large subunit ribosomal protein L30
MIAVIRIKGQIGIKKDTKETLNRLNIKKKYWCRVIVNPKKEELGMIKKVSNQVAFGEINENTLEKIIEKRGSLIDKNKKVDVKKIIVELKKGKKFEELNLRNFFRLHPPRKGIDSKKHFGTNKGVLGNNKEKINDLIMRML